MVSLLARLNRWLGQKNIRLQQRNADAAKRALTQYQRLQQRRRGKERVTPQQQTDEQTKRPHTRP